MCSALVFKIAALYKCMFYLLTYLCWRLSSPLPRCSMTVPFSRVVPKLQLAIDKEQAALAEEKMDKRHHLTEDERRHNFYHLLQSSIVVQCIMCLFVYVWSVGRCWEVVKKLQTFRSAQRILSEPQWLGQGKHLQFFYIVYELSSAWLGGLMFNALDLRSRVYGLCYAVVLWPCWWFSFEFSPSLSKNYWMRTERESDNPINSPVIRDGSPKLKMTTRTVLNCDQSNYFSHIIFSYTFTLEPNTNWIGWTVSEIWPFKITQNDWRPRSWIWSSRF